MGDLDMVAGEAIRLVYDILLSYPISLSLSTSLSKQEII